ncbi:hypothetical protein KFD70_28465 [Bacillus pfraonensis]|uniref:hypothetical protein n=1 Tax=Bacillus TaxID=1386 RepID=UPI002A55B3A8|nr:hypothetical protein [Bacillus pseudomycoides]
MAFETNCATCEGDNTILSVHTGRIDIELLGLNVEVCPICIRVFTSDGSPLTPAQDAQVQQIISAIQNLQNSFVPNP